MLGHSQGEEERSARLIVVAATAINQRDARLGSLASPFRQAIPGAQQGRPQSIEILLRDVVTSAAIQWIVANGFYLRSR